MIARPAGEMCILRSLSSVWLGKTGNEAKRVVRSTRAQLSEPWRGQMCNGSLTDRSAHQKS